MPLGPIMALGSPTLRILESNSSIPSRDNSQKKKYISQIIWTTLSLPASLRKIMLYLGKSQPLMRLRQLCSKCRI